MRTACADHCACRSVLSVAVAYASGWRDAALYGSVRRTCGSYVELLVGDVVHVAVRAVACVARWAWSEPAAKLYVSTTRSRSVLVSRRKPERSFHHADAFTANADPCLAVVDIHAGDQDARPPHVYALTNAKHQFRYAPNLGDECSHSAGRAARRRIFCHARREHAGLQIAVSVSPV